MPTPDSAESEDFAAPLNVAMYPCDTLVDDSQEFDGYTKVLNGTCTYCEGLCQPPSIDSTIKFFDGFEKTQVFITYASLIGLTIVWQVYLCACRKKKTEEEFEHLMKTKNDSIWRVNQTVTTTNRSSAYVQLK